MTIGDSMVAGSKDDAYYVEKYYQLIRFTNKYATTKNFVNHMSLNMDNIEAPSADFSSNNVVAREDNNIGRNPDLPDVTEGETVYPTYSIPNDFDKERTEKISNYRFTARLSEEPLDVYYARMYRAALA